MIRKLPAVALLAPLGILLTTAGIVGDRAEANPGARDAGKRARVAWSKLLIAFEPRETGAGGTTEFLASSGRTPLRIGATGADFTLAALPGSKRAGAQIRMRLDGVSPRATPRGEERLPGTVNHFRGRDPSAWRSGIPTFARVRCAGVYPGIDLVYYGAANRLEYDFVVAPGADPSAIRLHFRGADQVGLDPDGDLVLHAGGASLRQRRPVCYQWRGGVQFPIRGEFVLARAKPAGTDQSDARIVSFRIADYDRALPLTIDPVLVYSTFRGGSDEDCGTGVAVDKLGNAYVSGWTRSRDFPSGGAGTDAFVVKLNPAGTSALYTADFGGKGNDAAHAIAVDSEGSAYITGGTSSFDFPVSGGVQSQNAGERDAFIVKLKPTGGLSYSTYLGGADADEGFGIALDAGKNAYVAGRTASTQFPVVKPIMADGGDDEADAFIAKLNPAGNSLVYSTYLGGRGADAAAAIAVDSGANAYVTGRTGSTDFPTVTPIMTDPGDDTEDAFVAKVAPAGDGLVYSTYLGARGADRGAGIAVGSDGSAYVAGTTASSDFRTTADANDRTFNGETDGFAAKLNPAGRALTYSTYLGGAGFDDVAGIGVDSGGRAYLVGTARPLTPDGAGDATVTALTPTGAALLYAVNLVGTRLDLGMGIAVDGAGTAFVTGRTFSPDFPTERPLQAALRGMPDSTGLYAADAFIVRIGAPAPPPAPSSLAGEALSPSSIRLTWLDNSDDEIRFEIERHGAGGAFAPVKSVGPNTTAFDDIGLTVDALYVYRVRAINNFGASDYSAEATFRTVPPGKLLLSRDRLSFGGVKTGKKKRKTLTLTNDGTGEVRGEVVSPVAPFSVLLGGGAFTLQPRQRLKVRVQFAPSKRGAAAGELVVRILFPGTAERKVALTGKGR